MPLESKNSPDHTRATQGKNKPDPNPWAGVGRLSTLGLELGLTVAILCVLGWWLDGQWGTSPWLTLAGAAIAIVGITYKLLRVSASMDRKSPKD